MNVYEEANAMADESLACDCADKAYWFGVRRLIDGHETRYQVGCCCRKSALRHCRSLVDIVESVDHEAGTLRGSCWQEPRSIVEYEFEIRPTGRKL